MIPIYPPKFEKSIMDFRYDFTKTLDPGDTLDTVYVTAPAGVTVVSYALVGNNVVLAMIAGGTAGVEYTIEFGGTTLYGYTLQEFAILPVTAPV